VVWCCGVCVCVCVAVQTILLGPESACAALNDTHLALPMLSPSTEPYLYSQPRPSQMVALWDMRSISAQLDTTSPAELDLHCCGTLLQPSASIAAVSRSVVSLAMCRGLLAACFNRLPGGDRPCVCVWDVPTRELLRTISLPERTHSFFHPNVIVAGSLSHYGLHICLDDYRIALSAVCTRGDWREPLDGHPAMLATSLLVVQEVGPEFVREAPAPSRRRAQRAGAWTTG